MRFIHLADVHFDCAFSNLSDRENLGDKLRIKQRNAFLKVIEYIKAEKIEYLFIAGDLYENSYIKTSTINFLNDCFKKIPFCNVYITPGNHDPKLKNSFYEVFKFAENVKIFSSELEKVEVSDENGLVNIYGYGFEDFYMKTPQLEDLVVQEDCLNILVTHSSLDDFSSEKQYNPLKTTMLKQLGLDYVALGHIHKNNFEGNEQNNIIYPGSLIPLGFDELGEHGFLDVTLTKSGGKVKLSKTFVPIEEFSFKEIEVDISNMYDISDVAFKINSCGGKDVFVKVILTGTKNFEIDVLKLFKLIDNENVIKIKDNSKIKLDIESVVNEYSLKGLFFKNVVDLNLSDEQKEELFQIGLNLFG